MRLVALVACLLPCAAALAAPATPVVVTHQGRLLDGSNAPVTSELAMTFRIFSTYDVLSSEAPLWEETYPVQVVEGVYGVLLGDTLGTNSSKHPLPATVFGGIDRYLSVTIAGNEFKPRLRVGSVPFAFRAESAAAADLAKTVAAGAIATEQLAAGAVTADKLAAGAVGTTHLGDGQVTLAKLATTSGKFVGLNADLLDGLDSSAFAPAAIETKVDSLLSDTATLKGDTTQLRADTTALKTDTGTLKTDTSTLKADTGTLKADTTTLKTDTGTLKTDTAAIRTSLTGTDGKVDGVVAKVANIESVVTASGKRWGTYSKSCVDAVAKGWTNVSDCLTDGRWHFYFNAGGTARTDAGPGVSNVEFYAASQQGADTKIRMGEDWYDTSIRYQNDPTGFWVFLKDRNPLFSFRVNSNGSIDSINVSMSNAYDFNDAWWNNPGDFGNRHHMQSSYSYRGARTTAFPMGGIDFWAKY